MAGASRGGRARGNARASTLANRVRRDLLLVVTDALLLAASLLVALVLRYEGSVPEGPWSEFVRVLPFVVGLAVAGNAAWGLYGHVWKHAGILEARRLLLAGTVVMSVLVVSDLLGRRWVPLSVAVLGPLLATLLSGLVRFHARLLAVNRGQGARDRVTRVVVLGAGEAGAALLRDMHHRRAAGVQAVAILDDDPRLWGRKVLGIDVLGGLDSLDSLELARRSPDQAVLAVPSADSALIRKVAGLVDQVGLPLKVLPVASDLINGDVGVGDLRELRIEDLLGRTQVGGDPEAVRLLLAGRRVLITGAGGSIGSEIARQVAAAGPSLLVLLDNDETHLHDTVATLGHYASPVQALADIRSAQDMGEVFGRHRPQVVFHAAALKHVPLLETHPREALRTNVGGTENVLDAAVAVGAERFVFVSTDKAVSPSSVMGASKWLAEQVVLGRDTGRTHVCAVRFGNVLGSRGSVVPTFALQIGRGGPVTVTDPRMTRFFMSIPEAVQLVVQAASMAGGGEIFMLDMGEPVRIIDLAKRMIRLSGHRVGSDIEIRVTGVRPGEKLEEQLRRSDELATPTAHSSVARLQPALLGAPALRNARAVLRDLVTSRDDAGLCRFLLDLAGDLPAARDRVTTDLSVEAAHKSSAPGMIDLRPIQAEATARAQLRHRLARKDPATERPSWSPSTT